MRPTDLKRCVRRPSALRTECLALTLLALSIASAGCGRKASESDCDFIVDRYVEVELTTLKVTDPKIISERKEEMRKDLKEDLKACPGKRVTDAMLECVRRAQSNDELDKCTRW
jgi:hypothetical protein